MPRRYYRRSYRRYSNYVPRSLKYSNETFRATRDLVTPYSGEYDARNIVVTQSADSLQGTRKVKNFTLTISVKGLFGT